MQLLTRSPSIDTAETWFLQNEWQPFPFQYEVWQAYLSGNSGLLNAPTGCGKTYALWIPCLLEYMQQYPENYQNPRNDGLQILWITPLKALAKDIQGAMQRACNGLQIPWKIGVRTGDTSTAERQKQKKHLPECLITTPESLHLLLSQRDCSHIFNSLKAVIVDEWHELMGTKRGVQMELALSRLKGMHTQLKVWGISATIGNLDQALEVLLGNTHPPSKTIIKAEIEKKLEIKSILPDTIPLFPWTGQLGIKLLPKILPIIEKSKTTLLFTNTRAQTEIWYQTLLEKVPDLAGIMAMHHGSLDNKVRTWVEEALHAGKLKLVICTSSLDLGVDFRPVETVIQAGSPKGVGRFVQRAGRSGHQPGAVSTIYFLPSHSLELVEAAAIREAIRQKHVESRKPLEKSLDVLVQYLVTLAVGEGFDEQSTFEEVKSTYAFRHLTQEEWKWVLRFITTGGESLEQYDEYCKVFSENGKYTVTSRRTATRHRVSIGTIVSDPVLRVKYVAGGNIGTVEESFISRLKKGDTFWFAGRALQLERIKEMTVLVRPSRKKTGIIPHWLGGRMPLSSQLSDMIRQKLQAFNEDNYDDIELKAMAPLLRLQQKWSAIPDRNSLLIEQFHSQDGYHVFMYPFAGRTLHEAVSALVAWRISQLRPITFSIAFNDYGFELLSDQVIPLEEALAEDLFTTLHLKEDLLASINSTEMAKRRFREIAAIAGLVFQGYPGKGITNKHLQASAQIIYDVFAEYDPDNLLIQQAMDEAFDLQIGASRLAEILRTMGGQHFLIKHPPQPTPFAFPIMADRMREKISSETLEDRIIKMQQRLEAYAENEE